MTIDSGIMSKMLSRLVPMINVKVAGSDTVQRNILVTKEGLTAGNYEYGAFIPMYTGAEEPFLIPGNTAELLMRLPSGTVTIEPDGNGTLHIKCGKIKNKAQMRPAKDCSTFQRAQEFSVTTSAIDLTEMSGRAMYAAAPLNRARPILEGLNFKAKDKKLTITGIDGFRVSSAWCDADGEDEFTIHANSAKALASFGIVGDVQIGRNGNTITFRSETGDEFHCRTMADGYPDADKLTPNCEYTLKFNRDEMLEAITRVRLVIRDAEGDGSKTIILDIGENSIAFTGRTQLNDYSETIPAESDHDIKIALDARYLTDFLKNAPDKEIIIRYDKPVTPMVHRGSNYMALLLPVHIQQ